MTTTRKPVAAYSGLEVVHAGYDSNDKIPYQQPLHSNLEAAPPIQNHGEKHTFAANAAYDNTYSQPVEASQRKKRWSRKKKVLIGIVLLVVVIAVVVGAVCGVLLNKKGSSSSAANDAPPAR